MSQMFQARWYTVWVSLDEHLLEILRLGLNGDTSSIRRYAKRLIRRGELPDTVSQEMNTLLGMAPEASPLRSVHPVQTSRDPVALSTPPPTKEVPLHSRNVSQEVELLVQERLQPEALERAKLTPTRTLLLTGGPGVGKTLTASHIAQRLELPLFRLDLSMLMSSYLGQTGKNLRDALNAAKESPSVLFLDEFDAIAKRRNDPSDVGELKRIVNVLLLELDAWPADGLLIAATNHPELLDRAIWRRFERVINISVPDALTRRQLLLKLLNEHAVASSEALLELLVDATAGSSGADVVGLVRAAVRKAALDQQTPVERCLAEEALVRLAQSAQGDDQFRTAYCRIAHEVLGETHREIAARLNVSHATVGRALRKKN